MSRGELWFRSDMCRLDALFQSPTCDKIEIDELMDQLRTASDDLSLLKGNHEILKLDYENYSYELKTTEGKLDTLTNNNKALKQRIIEL